MLKIIDYYTKSKTLIVMTVLALVPALDLLHQIDVQAILAPTLGVETATHWGEMYVLVVVGAAKILRLFTTLPIADKTSINDKA